MLLPTDLLGRWRLTRRVLDRRSGEIRHVSGTTTLEFDGADRVRWSESGTMVWPGGRAAVERSLLVDRRSDDTWTVSFADGRSFHEWRPDLVIAYDCAPDRYEGLITGTTDAWSVVWEATGPTKRYRMESTNSTL